VAKEIKERGSSPNQEELLEGSQNLRI